MIAILVVLALALVLGPQLWARHALKRHARARPDLPGNGGEFARHLLAQARMHDYRVERAADGVGDHFDPTRRVVALSAAHHDQRSLAAVVVAAHEVGHAIQHHIGYRPLYARQRLARFAGVAEKLAALALVAMPFLAVVTRAPAAGAGLLLLGIGGMLIPVLVHLVTLPVELDASFRRALPILELGYLERRDLPAARRILAACALTYVAGALASLLNFARWIRVLRR
ncbi:MAG: zinc metallopeptidase [Gammaproteobacteria bacterium]